MCPDCLADPEPLAAEFYCVSCRTPFVNRFPLDEDGQCPLCRMGLKGFDAVYTYGSYEGRLRRLIHLYKFHGMRPLAVDFGRWMARAIPREQQFDAIVPMPLHWTRRFQRGFNQSELLAQEIARRWNVPVVEAVQRPKRRDPQAGLTNAQRRKNVQGVFHVPQRLDGQRILLIDDVMTTGATASACARAMKRAGAAHVALAAVARTDRRSALDLDLVPKHQVVDTVQPGEQSSGPRQTGAHA